MMFSTIYALSAASEEPSPMVVPGQSVRCSAGGNNNPLSVYMYFSDIAEIRWYPSQQIAAQNDPNWYNAPEIDCTKLTLGEDMPAGF